MNLEQRIELLEKLGKYLLNDDEQLKKIKEKAAVHNAWFIPLFINLSIKNIAEQFLQKNILIKWATSNIKYQISNPKRIGIVMAGNIPLVGFHDFLCVFISGHKSVIKTSSKDDVLIRHIVEKLIEWEPKLSEEIFFSEILKNCDAYIATGSNSSAKYFDYYFEKYPHIIRRNRTSVAMLQGDETREELTALADDVHLYFGMGCRNITKIFVPRNYNFEPLIEIFKKYNFLADFHKYKNNYDYNLALLMLNKKYYMSTGSLLLVEDENIFSPVSQLHYEFYDDEGKIISHLQQNENLQCIVGENFIPFGEAQCPVLSEYADGMDTMKFLIEDL
jgi:hypothetical protein